MKHNKYYTPWDMGPYYGSWTIGNTAGAWVAKIDYEWKAKLIVERVNAHDDLVDALKFYADPANYNCDFGDASTIDRDMGGIANEALKKHGIS